MEDSIFTKIIKGELPSYKVYENEKAIAILDIHPVSLGHVIVIAKAQVPTVWELPEEDYRLVMDAAKTVAQKLQSVLQTKHVGAQVVGVDVPHAHVHLIPFNFIEEFRNIPDMNKSPDDKTLAELVNKLKI